MTDTAPRAFNRHIYDDHRENVFYGTDDGAQDGSFSEFTEFERHYNDVEESRKDNIHMISVVGGLYGLNMIPLWKPSRITFFDINPAAISYLKVVLRMIDTSDSKETFLQRMANGDCETYDELEQFVLENIQMRCKDELPRSRGSSKRSYEESWTKMLDQFELTKQILAQSEVEIRTEPMESESFSSTIYQKNNLWIYASNITQFHFFDLTFKDTSNIVIVQIIHPNQPQLLDLAPLAGGEVKLNVKIPLQATKIG